MFDPSWIDPIIPALVAGFAAFIFGWLWYGVFFTKQWNRLSGMSEEGMKPKVSVMILGLLAFIVKAYIIGHFIIMLPVEWWGAASAAALLFWIGFALTDGIGVVIYQKKSCSLFGLNAVHDLISLQIIAAVLFFMLF